MADAKIVKIKIPADINIRKLTKRLRDDHGITVLSVEETSVMDAEDEHYRDVRGNISRNHHLDFTQF